MPQNSFRNRGLPATWRFQHDGLRFVSAQQVGRSTSPRLILEVDIGERLSVGVANTEAPPFPRGGVGSGDLTYLTFMTGCERPLAAKDDWQAKPSQLPLRDRRVRVRFFSSRSPQRIIPCVQRVGFGAEATVLGVVRLIVAGSMKANREYLYWVALRLQQPR